MTPRSVMSNIILSIYDVHLWLVPALLVLYIAVTWDNAMAFPGAMMLI